MGPVPCNRLTIAMQEKTTIDFDELDHSSVTRLTRLSYITGSCSISVSPTSSGAGGGERSRPYNAARSIDQFCRVACRGYLRRPEARESEWRSWFSE
jgi:hypothetical protein